MMEWENIKWLDDYNESKYYKTAKEPLIILSTSNMLDNGRILEWVQSMLPDRNNTIIFCGYTTEDSLATRIKDKSNAQVFIDKKFYVNECKLIDLQSYSSHITRSELLNLHGLNANYDRLVLVHGEVENKKGFSQEC
jgi:Predicted metal-dependent RNase, consists of a metallo-beta-lactamase domain and an RNA-binding KH domain